MKPWPTDFTDDDRDNVIQSYITVRQQLVWEKLMSTTHGKTIYGRYKQSPVSIIHWQSGKAKADFEYYTYRKFNKRYPATIWDRNNKTVYHHTGEAHRIIFTPQVSDMERDINLAAQATLHIITKHDESDLANSWGKVAVKWQAKLAIRNEDHAVIFKLVRSDEDPKFPHLHVHRHYYETARSAWSWGWTEANAKTRWPDYSRYPYIVKFDKLRSNEEYRTLHNARWGYDQHQQAAAASHEQQQDMET